MSLPSSRSASLTVLLTLAAAASGPAAASAQSRTADSLAIVSQAAAFSRAYERGDTDAMVAIYTDDAVIFPDRSAAISGTEAIQRYWTLRPGNRVISHRIIPAAIRFEGSIVYDYGTFEVTGETDGTSWGPNGGKYVVVWRRDADGAWRMHLDIWNRGSPAP